MHHHGAYNAPYMNMLFYDNQEQKSSKVSRLKLVALCRPWDAGKTDRMRTPKSKRNWAFISQKIGADLEKAILSNWKRLR